MITFNLDETSTFQFEMQIFGDDDTGASPLVEFKIKTAAAAFSFPAKQIGNGVYEVSVPSLVSMVKPGSYVAEVTVVLGDRYFTPLTESVELKTPIKPVISNFKPLSSKEESKIEIQVKTVHEPTIKVEAVQVKPEPKVAAKRTEESDLIEQMMKKTKI